MVTFDNVLDETVNGVCRWKRKGILREATIIRDVYGKIALLLDNTAAVSDEDSQELETCLDQAIGPFFGGHVYYKKQSHNKRNIETRIQPIVDIIETEREMWREEEGIAFFVSERPIAKKAWIKTSAKQESVWPYEEAIEDGGTKVVAFYSFKGGMGRTTALAAAAINLVRQGKNVMMVDMDIEAPGLATLFFPENRIERGVLDYLLESEIADNTDIHDYVLDVTEPALIEENYGMLYLMPAGKVNEQYLQKLARIDYQDNRENHLRTSVGTMLKRLRDGYGVDYLLIDARAGFHDLGGVAVSQLPHGSVLFGDSSRQSWDGIRQVLRSIAKSHASDFPVMLVDSRCDKPTSPYFAEAKKAFIGASYTVFLDCFYDNEESVPGIDSEESAHYPEFIYSSDDLLRGVELYSDGSPEKDDLVTAYRQCLTEECYRKLTARIEGWFGENES